jgi:DNA-binding transcriptional ArsR family regulator
MAKRFPQETYQKLDGIDLKLLDEIAFLSRQQRKRTGSAYCRPSRAYLGKKLGVDVGTISRHTSKLVDLGVLDKQQRRPVRGIWQTCLYRLRNWQAWALGRVAGFLRKIGNNHRVRLDARKLPCERNKETSEVKITASAIKTAAPNNLEQELMQRWEAKGFIPKLVQ